VDVGLLPRFPCPVSVFVVVWQLLFWQFPTGFGADTQTLVPASLVNVPPEASHCVCEGDAASVAVVPKANNDIDPSNIKAVRDFVRMYSSLGCTQKTRAFFVSREKRDTSRPHLD
jgi:hypothetical protein